VTFSVSSGTLPSGLSLNASSGAITGIPSLSAGPGGGTATAKTYTFTIKVADNAGDTPATESYTVTINPAISLSTTLPGWTVNEPGYDQAIAVTGGTGGDTFALTGGTLPTGLSLNPATGVITGTPTIAVAYSFQITATDSVGATGSATYSVTIGGGLAISTTTLTAGTANVAYSQTIATTGGTGTPVFSYTGTLPPGVPLSTTGTLSGTPTTPGTYTFTITAADTGGAAVSRAYTLKINPGSALTPATLPNSSVGKTGYSQTITVTGGGTNTFKVTTGSLPNGLSLNNSTGAITGTPTKAGTYTFTITATSSTSTTTAQSYTVAIAPALVLTPTALTPIVVNSPYSETITASGGTGTLTISYVVNGTLPTGLSIKVFAGSRLTITGTPKNDDYATISVTVTDSTGATTEIGYVLSQARRRGGE
jgi:hypothetical protein